MTRTKREVIVRDVGGRIGGEQGASKRGRWLEAVWLTPDCQSVCCLSVGRDAHRLHHRLTLSPTFSVHCTN